MKVYVETNFILEMAFEQNQSTACEAILQLAEQTSVHLAIPAFCFTEPHGRLQRQNHARGELQRKLAGERKEFSRSPHFTEEQKTAWDTVSGMLVSSTQQAEQRLGTVRGRVLRTARILPLTASVIEMAVQGQVQYGLQFPDALVLSSVLEDLQSGQEQACFLNANSKDFDEPAVVNDLKKRNCKPMWRFDAALEYIRATVQKPAG